jgi:mediator of RNA polymerase II transcription subunit 12, fungi type
MPSHPAVGNRPLPQQRNVGVARPPRGSQSAAQSSSSVAQRGRKRALDADGATEVADSRMQDGQSQLTKTLTGTLAVPPFNHPFESPEAGLDSPRIYKPFQADSSSKRNKTDQTIPFPSRPGRNVAGLGRTAQLGVEEPAVGQKIELRLYTGEAPIMARKFPQGRKLGSLSAGIYLTRATEPADCCFWKGVQVEDNLAEQTIKSGFQNKALLSNETNTARPSIWSHLKKHGGPLTLSSLFVTLLEKRQTTGRISGPSTFKPPPRLTMSNTRRESFLRELADPSWPMRKLNRSVPHTISGRLLLEQCLSKNIPTSRAVWLAKCIGANDIRAFKRKWASGATAMGSEAKWIKEWTIHVEQFIKGTFGCIGEPDWKSKFEYVLRLSSHLFFDQLLDHDHYLDWIITSFETSSLEHLPAWLLLVQIYWDSLVCNRKRGRWITEALLNHLEQFSSEDIGDLIQPLLAKMQSLLTILAVSHKGCLILPRTWSRFKNIIQSIPGTAKNPDLSSAIDILTTRNDRLVLRAGTDRVHNPEKELIILLDTARIDVSIGQLALRCVEVGAHVSILVRTVLRWAASVYRQGDHRVYIAAALLSRFKDHHSDVDAAIWNVAAGLENDRGIHEVEVCRVVAELVRSRQFSIGPFLRYLISTGAVSSPHDSTKVSFKFAIITKSFHANSLQPIPPLLRLLQDLPDQDLPEEVSNLRKILLQSAGLASPVEDVSSATFQAAVLAQISSIQSGGDWAYPILEVVDLHLCQRFPLAIWLRDLMLSNAGKEPESADHNTWNLLSTNTAAQGTFCVIRDALEQLQDYPCLADVLEITLETNDQHLLTSITDTLNYGYRCFVALGAMKNIFNKLVDRYETMRSGHTLLKPFCLALLKLCSTLDADQSLVAQLNQDLIRCDQLNTAAICSPASDNAELFQASYTDLDEEIERILGSGSLMDEQMVDRMFKRITSRVEEHYKTAGARVPIGQWLLRLRGFDSHAFDQHMRDWISSLLSKMETWKMLYDFILPGVVGSGCLSLGDFVQCAEQCAEALSEKDLSFQCCFQVEFLEALLPDPALAPQCSVPVRVYPYPFNKWRSLIFNRKHTSIGLKDEPLRSPIDR